MRFVEDVRRALESYVGKNAEHAKDAAQALANQRVVFDDRGGGFAVGGWRYDSSQSKLEKTILDLGSEKTWVEIHLSSDEEGMTVIGSIEVNRDYLSIIP